VLTSWDFGDSAGRECEGEAEKPNPTNHMRQPAGGAFVLPYKIHPQNRGLSTVLQIQLQIIL
jgi:hypothetical protein